MTRSKYFNKLIGIILNNLLRLEFGVTHPFPLPMNREGRLFGTESLTPPSLFIGKGAGGMGHSLIFRFPGSLLRVVFIVFTLLLVNLAFALDPLVLLEPTESTTWTVGGQAVIRWTKNSDIVRSCLISLSTNDGKDYYDDIVGNFIGDEDSLWGLYSFTVAESISVPNPLKYGQFMNVRLISDSVRIRIEDIYFEQHGGTGLARAISPRFRVLPSSAVEKTAMINLSPKFSISPNPSMGVARILFFPMGSGGEAVISIYGLQGRLIRQLTGANGAMDVSGLVAGQYFVKARCGNHAVQTGKLIIQK